MKNTIWQILYIKSCIIKYVYAYNACHRFGRKHTSQIFLLNFVFFNPTSGCWMPKLQAEPRNCNVRGRLCWKSGFESLWGILTKGILRTCYMFFSVNSFCWLDIVHLIWCLSEVNFHAHQHLLGDSCQGCPTFFCQRCPDLTGFRTSPPRGQKLVSHPTTSWSETKKRGESISKISRLTYPHPSYFRMSLDNGAISKENVIWSNRYFSGDILGCGGVRFTIP